MRDCGVIKGSLQQAKSLIIGKDTVYIHTDIVKIELDEEGSKTDNLYQYHEVQYDKDEYIQLISEQNTEMKQEILNTQLALCEIYESLNQ